MKKALVVLLAAVFCFSGVAFGQSHKQINERLRILEQDVENLKEEMKMALMPSDLEIYQDENPPSEVGDIKIVSGFSEISDCDSLAAWSIVSGDGVSIVLDTEKVKEGSSSIKVTIPAGITAVLKCVGTWNFSTGKYLKVWLFESSGGGLSSCHQHFGETSYLDNSSAHFNLATGYWQQKSWDISGIGTGDRDAVIEYGLTLPGRVTVTAYVHIDYAICDSGPSAVKAFDGDRVILLYPKVYSSSYVGNGTSQTITIPRKGTPSRIQIDRMTKPSILWISGMESGHSKKMAQDTSGGTGVIEDITDGITAVADCSFTVGAATHVNAEGVTHFFTIFWDD